MREYHQPVISLYHLPALPSVCWIWAGTAFTQALGGAGKLASFNKALSIKSAKVPNPKAIVKSFLEKPNNDLDNK